MVDSNDQSVVEASVEAAIYSEGRRHSWAVGTTWQVKNRLLRAPDRINPDPTVFVSARDAW